MKTTVHPPLEFDVIGENLGFPEGPVICADGSVLVVDIDAGTVLRIADGTTTVVARPGGGPNGLAIGPGGYGYIANNGGFRWGDNGFGKRIPIDRATHNNEPEGFEGGWIERVDLSNGAVEVVHGSSAGRRLRGPNDLVFDAAGGLWFTDLGKARHQSVDRGGLYYLPPDGDEVREVAFPLLGANGVGLSPNGDRVYVAETHTGRVWAWDLADFGVVIPAPGSLAVRHGGTCVVATPYSLDSMAIEADGRLAIGAIADGLIVVTPDGAEVDVYPVPDDVTTNIAFGGPDHRRAVVTLSRSSRLVELTWPRPGLALNFG